MKTPGLTAAQEVRSLVERGKAAQERLAHYSEGDIDKIVSAMADKARQRGDYLARLAAGETGRGNLESKLAKHRFVLEQALEATQKISRKQHTVAVLNSVTTTAA